jgi:putative nucleotidyltransferase with HDIG domain
MIDKSYIESVFPELNEIKDKTLRDGVIKAWLLAVEKGGWKKIDDIPFTLLIPDVKISLIEHTRRVTKMAMAIAKVRDDLNLDYIIAGGLTHDVGKLLEYEKVAGKIIKSHYGKLIRHPVSGYHLALEVGLPLEVAHIILAHSTEGDKVSRSKEAIVIHYCDFIEFEIVKAHSN